MLRRVLITGRGSIARRHVQHLRVLQPEAAVAVVAAGPVDAAAFQGCEVLPDFGAGLAWRPDAVVIASVSSRHAAELAACLEQGLPCLAEKPLAIGRGELDRLRRAAEGSSVPVQVGCNLRHLPALQRLRRLLAEAAIGRLMRAQLEVGQDLRQWRPGRDLGTSYSAHGDEGGGVVFDLVHEIDMALWLLGPLRVKAAAGGHLSALPIAADDVHAALLVDEAGAPVTIALDYVSQRPVRRYAFVGERGRLEVDLIDRELGVADASESRCLSRDPADFDVPATYRTQMADWLAAVRDPAHRLVSPLDEAFRTTELMLAMKEAQ